MPNALIADLADRLPGVGPITAKAMCQTIGKNNILGVLNGVGPENKPDWRESATSSSGGWQQRRYQAILDCGRISRHLAESICTAWDAGAPTRDAENFLMQHGFNRLHSAQVPSPTHPPLPTSTSVAISSCYCMMMHAQWHDTSIASSLPVSTVNLMCLRTTVTHADECNAL